MKKFKVTFTDIVEAKTEREAYENFMTYIRECAKYSDLEAFEFEEVVEDGNGHEIKLPVKR